jgi:hypothetical protein
MGLIVRHLAGGLADAGLWETIDRAGEELLPIERETRRAAQTYRRLAPNVAFVDVTNGYARIDKTLLLLLGQEREPVSVVLDRNNVSVAAGFDSGKNFLQIFELEGGMPTRVSLPRKRLADVLRRLEVAADDVAQVAEGVE